MQNCYPRFNAGRPNLPASQRTTVISASVLPAQKEWVVQLGEGNLSVGIRKAIATAMQALSPELVAAEIAKRQAYVADAPKRQAEDDALQDAALADFANKNPAVADTGDFD